MLTAFGWGRLRTARNRETQTFTSRSFMSIHRFYKCYGEKVIINIPFYHTLPVYYLITVPWEYILFIVKRCTKYHCIYLDPTLTYCNTNLHSHGLYKLGYSDQVYPHYTRMFVVTSFGYRGSSGYNTVLFLRCDLNFAVFKSHRASVTYRYWHSKIII